MFGEWATQMYVTVVENLRNAIEKDEEGQGMIEYGLLIALISIAAIAVITLIGTGLKNNFQTVLNSL